MTYIVEHGVGKEVILAGLVISAGLRLPLGDYLIVEYLAVPFWLVCDQGDEIKHASLAHSDAIAGEEVGNGVGKAFTVVLTAPVQQGVDGQAEARQSNASVRLSHWTGGSAVRTHVGGGWCFIWTLEGCWVRDGPR